MQHVSEKELREAIRYAISVEEKPALEEGARSYTVNISSSQFWDALIKPWIDVLKIAKLEAQKTLANLLTLFRVMTSFNRQKQQNIMDNHKDRIRDLDSKTKTLLDGLPISTDMAIMGFLLNPGASIARHSNVSGVATGVADFFRGAGFGDFTPGELASPDRNSTARARKREQSGLIPKMLRGLNSLFMAGHAPSGAMLLEQEEGEETEDVEPFEERDFSEVEMTGDGINLIIDEGGGLPGVKEAREAMIADAESFLGDAKTANKLVELLGSIAQVQDLDQYMSVLDEISKISPETGMASRAEIEQSLEADTKSIADQEGAEEEAAKMVLRRQGNSEPTEEEIAAVGASEKEAEIRSIAFGNILGQLRASASESAQGIYDTHKTTYDTLYPEDLEPAIKKIVDSSPYGENLNAAADLLKNMESLVNSLGA